MIQQDSKKPLNLDIQTNIQTKTEDKKQSQRVSQGSKQEKYVQGHDWMTLNSACDNVTATQANQKISLAKANENKRNLRKTLS